MPGTQAHPPAPPPPGWLAGWLANPVTGADLVRANTLFDAHREPGFGYRFLVAKADDSGQRMAERTDRRTWSDNNWWSALGKRNAARAAHDGPVDPDFTADLPHQLWLADFTGHLSAEGELYCVR